MLVTLRSIYEVLSWFSTASHIAMCDDLLRKINAAGADNLAQLFADAFVSNREFNQVDQPFVDDRLLENREPLNMNSRGTNRVAYAMSQADEIDVETLPTYVFRYLEREVPHLRTQMLNEHNDKGWIDYIAAINGTPILGEIKYDSDQNPFYAVTVQLAGWFWFFGGRGGMFPVFEYSLNAARSVSRGWWLRSLKVRKTDISTDWVRAPRSLWLQ